MPLIRYFARIRSQRECGRIARRPGTSARFRDDLPIGTAPPPPVTHGSGIAQGKQRTQHYRAEIDGLRAVAVVPVILFHAGFSWFSGGFVGVDIFFVISGYLITTIILSELEQGRFSIINFYERRARRILPALFTVLLVCLPFAWLWLLPREMKGFAQSLAAVSLFSSNLLFWHTSGYFGTAAELKPLLHTWSLAVEEQYYVIFPVFLLLAWRLGKRWVLALLGAGAVISLAAAQWGATAKPLATFYLLPTRGWELLIGAFVAFYFSNKDRSAPGRMVRETGGLIGLLMLVFAILAFGNDTPYPSVYTLVPTVGAALIILCADPDTVVGTLLGSKLFAGIGLISYSAYLWHQPLFAFARHRSLNEPGKGLLGALALVSIGLAYFSWKYVEVPFRDKRQFQRKAIFAGAGVGTACLIALGLAGSLADGFPQRFSREALQVYSPASSRTEKQSAACDRGGVAYAPLKSSCVLGDPRNIVGVLVGDSHANALAYELGREAEKSGVGLLQFTFMGCPPIEGVYRADMDAVDQCYQFDREVAQYIKSHPGIKYVVAAARWTRYLKSSGFDNGEGGVERSNDLVDIVGPAGRERNSEAVRVAKLEKTYVESLQSYLGMGKSVILVYPVPEVGWNVPDYLAKSIAFSPRDFRRSTSYQAYRDRNREAFQTLDAIGNHANLFRVYPDRELCDRYISGRCIFEWNGQSLYYDHNHLANAGARLIVGDIVKDMVPEGQGARAEAASDASGKAESAEPVESIESAEALGLSRH